MYLNDDLQAKLKLWTKPVSIFRNKRSFNADGFLLQDVVDELLSHLSM